MGPVILGHHKWTGSGYLIILWFLCWIGSKLVCTGYYIPPTSTPTSENRFLVDGEKSGFFLRKNGTHRSMSFIFETLRMSYCAECGWRTVWQREIDENQHSSGSLVLLLRPDGTDLGVGVLASNSTILIPIRNGAAFDKKQRIWLMGHDYMFTPVAFTHLELILGKDAALIHFKPSHTNDPLDLLPAPAKPVQFISGFFHNLPKPERTVDLTSTNSSSHLPPEATNCSLFSFRSGETFELRRLNARVTNTRTQRCSQDDGLSHFCVEVEDLSIQAPSHRMRGSKPAILEGPLHLEYKEFKDWKSGKLPGGEFPVFCSPWLNWMPDEMDSNARLDKKTRKSTFTGFARYERINSTQFQVVVQLFP